jgi:mRNA interferase RelE/StbE
LARYRVYIKRSASQELEAVAQKTDRRRLIVRIQALAEEPRPARCEKLAGYDDRYRVRQGDYRIVYAVDDTEKVVTIFKIGHRREVYR